MSELSAAIAARLGVALDSGFAQHVIYSDNPLQSREKTMDEVWPEKDASRVPNKIRRKFKRLRDKANGGFVYYPPNWRTGKEWGFQP